MRRGAVGLPCVRRSASTRFYSRWMFIATEELNKLQLNSISNSPSTATTVQLDRTVTTRNSTNVST
jgi:hypothetical protein